MTNLFSKRENLPLVDSTKLCINFQVFLVKGLRHRHRTGHFICTAEGRLSTDLQQWVEHAAEGRMFTDLSG